MGSFLDTVPYTLYYCVVLYAFTHFTVAYRTFVELVNGYVSMICHDVQELAGGKSGPSGLRRSSERSDVVENRNDRQSSNTSGEFFYVDDIVVGPFCN